MVRNVPTISQPANLQLIPLATDARSPKVTCVNIVGVLQGSTL